MIKDYQTTMLSLFIGLELKLAQLYRWLAIKFPEEADFFMEQHNEELKHAQWIEYFTDKVKAGQLMFNEDKTRTYTVNSFVNYVENIFVQTQGTLTLLKALSLAASIEESLIERKVLDHFSAESHEHRVLIERLKSDTNEHAVRLRQLLKKRTNSAGI